MAAAVLAAGRTPAQGTPLLRVIVLLACVAVTVIMTGRCGPDDSNAGQVLLIWYLPLAVLLRPGWACTASIPVAVLASCLPRRAGRARRIIAGLAAGIACAATSAVYALLSALDRTIPVPAEPGRLLAIILSGLALQLMAAAVSSAASRRVPGSRDPELSAPEQAVNILAGLSASILVTITAAASIWHALIAVPLVLPLHRSWHHARLQHSARTDSRTGLLNAAAWHHAAAAEAARAARDRTPLAVVMIDIDYFKDVNDTFGHQVGDDVLAGVAALVAGHLRPYDLAGRYGGEEFAVFLPATSQHEAAGIAERLRAHVAAAPLLPAAGASAAQCQAVTVSIGVAASIPEARSAHDLISAADQALYAAKHAGRNRVCTADHRSAPALPGRRQV